MAVLVVTRFDVPEDEAGTFLQQARAALAAFAARPGYLRGRVGRAADDPTAWVLTTEWVGGMTWDQFCYCPEAERKTYFRKAVSDRKLHSGAPAAVRRAIDLWRRSSEPQAAGPDTSGVT